MEFNNVDVWVDVNPLNVSERYDLVDRRNAVSARLHMLGGPP